MKNKELYKLIKKVNKNLIRTSSAMFKTRLDMGTHSIFPFIENMVDDKPFMDSLLGIAQNSKMEAIKYINESYEVYTPYIDELKKCICDEDKILFMYNEYIMNLNKFYNNYINCIDQRCPFVERCEFLKEIFNIYNNIFGYRILNIPKEKKKDEEQGAL